MTHRALCEQAAQWLLNQPWCDLACWELRFQKGFVDAIGLTSSWKAKELKITIVEVKRTRSDLLADLRAKKLLKYEKGSTHCYLAATPEALMLHKLTAKEALNDLKERGLPSHWGVLLLNTDETIVLRNNRRHATIVAATIAALNRKIARSLCYRILEGKLQTL